MKLLILLLALLILPSLSHAAQVWLALETLSTGDTQLRLMGENLCRANYGPGSFRMIKGSLDKEGLFIADREYISHSGRTFWPVQTDCSIDTQVTNDLLMKGRALAVEIYGPFGAMLYTFVVEAPLEERLR